MSSGASMVSGASPNKVMVLLRVEDSAPGVKLSPPNIIAGRAEFAQTEVIVSEQRRMVCGLVMAVMFLGIAGVGRGSQISIPKYPSTQPPDIEDETRRKWEHDREKKTNQERFQKIKNDTEKLVALSNELKDDVAKANEHTLSLDVIKKAEEIEKLARSVREKMKAN